MTNSCQVLLALALLASSVTGLMPDRPRNRFHSKPMSQFQNGMGITNRGQKMIDDNIAEMDRMKGKPGPGTGKTTALSVVRGRDAKSRSARLQALVEVVDGPDGHDHCEAAKTAEDCKTAHEAGEKNCIWQSDEKCKDNACGLTPTDDWVLWEGDAAKPEEPTLYCLYDDLLCLEEPYNGLPENHAKCYSSGDGGCKGTYYVRQEDGSYRVVQLLGKPNSIAGTHWNGESKDTDPQPCHVCEETEYESAPADKGKTDHVCTPLTGDACPVTHYDAGADTSPRTKDRDCKTLSPACNTIRSTNPLGDQFEKTPAVPGLHDRVCQALTVCSDTQRSSFDALFVLGQADRDCVEIPSISEMLSAAVLQKCGEKGEGKKAKRKFRRCKGKVKVKIQKLVKKQKRAQKKERKKERKQKNPKKGKKERRQKRR